MSERRQISIANVYKWGILFFGILILFGGMSYGFSTQRIRRSVEQSYQARTDFSSQKVAEKLQIINGVMSRMIISDKDFEDLKGPQDVRSQNVTINILMDTLNEYQNIVGKEYYFLIYDHNQEITVCSKNSYSDYREYLEFEKQMAEALTVGSISSPSIRNQWNYLRLGSDDYFVKALKSSELYLVCYTRVQSVLSYYLALDSGNKEYIHIATPEGETLGIYNPSEVALQGENKIQISLQGCNFILSLYVDLLGDYNSFMPIQLSILVLAASVLMIGVVFLTYMKRRLFNPLIYYTKHIAEFQNIELNDHRSPVAELNVVNDLILQMNQEIEQLKIDMYEEQLQKQNMKLEYLQSQLKPHFYINCLDIIHNMLRSHKELKAQDFTLELSKFLRSGFQSGTHLVLLGQELDILYSCINIYSLRYEGYFSCSVEGTEGLEDARVPAMLLVTFVENAIKHNVLEMEYFEIRIQMTREDGHLVIRIEDTGSGFRTELLALLNEGKNIRTQQSVGIGITNLLDRLEYFYKSDYQIRFYNQKKHGAGIYLQIPDSRPQQPNGETSNEYTVSG